MRKTLLGVYRPPFSTNIHLTLHRRLPWSYVSPSHERGHMKFYPNVRERIDEIVAETSAPDATHIPDVKCFHLRDVSDKSYLAYRRATKRISQEFSAQKLGENAFLRLASFMWKIGKIEKPLVTWRVSYIKIDSVTSVKLEISFRFSETKIINTRYV